MVSRGVRPRSAARRRGSGPDGRGRALSLRRPHPQRLHGPARRRTDYSPADHRRPRGFRRGRRGRRRRHGPGSRRPRGDVLRRGVRPLPLVRLGHGVPVRQGRRRADPRYADRRHVPPSHGRRPRPRPHLEDRRVRRTHCRRSRFAGEDRPGHSAGACRAARRAPSRPATGRPRIGPMCAPGTRWSSSGSAASAPPPSRARGSPARRRSSPWIPLRPNATRLSASARRTAPPRRPTPSNWSGT